MGEHLAVPVEELVKPEIVGSSQLEVEPSSSVAKDQELAEAENNEVADKESPLLTMEECCIFQEEDSLNNLESHCACSGSLKHAHRKCVQHWCNEKRDIACESCHKVSLNICPWSIKELKIDYDKCLLQRPPTKLFNKFSLNNIYFTPLKTEVEGECPWFFPT